MRAVNLVAFESVGESCASKFGNPPSLRGFRLVSMVAGSVFNSPSLSALSSDILLDRPRQILGRSGGNRLKQGQDDCHDTQ